MKDLFDFSFSKFITPKVIGIVYILAIFFAVIISLVLIRNSFYFGVLAGFSSLLLAPFLILFYIMLARITLESLLAIIKTAENTSIIKNNMVIQAKEKQIIEKWLK